MTNTQEHEHILDELDDTQAVEYNEQEDLVRVFVKEKKPERSIDENDLVRNRIDYPSTDVVEVGEITFELDFNIPYIGSNEEAEGQSKSRDIPEVENARKTRHRPVPTGVSEINENSTAATGGPLAKVTADEHNVPADWDDTSVPYVRVSNNHVYALVGDAQFGDDIYQPSPMDGGSSGDSVGKYVGSVPLNDGVTVDCAARTLKNGLEGEKLSPHKLGDGYGEEIKRSNYSDLYEKYLTKSGRTTGVTEGQVWATDATVDVKYSKDRSIKFRNQIMAFSMSKGGDSGSAVYDRDSKELVGLLFAGGELSTVVNRIDNVEKQLGVEMLTSKPSDGGEQSNVVKTSHAETWDFTPEGDNIYVSENNMIPSGSYTAELLENGKVVLTPN